MPRGGIMTVQTANRLPAHAFYKSLLLYMLVLYQSHADVALILFTFEYSML